MGAGGGLYIGGDRASLLLPNSQVGENSLAADYPASPLL